MTPLDAARTAERAREDLGLGKLAKSIRNR